MEYIKYRREVGCLFPFVDISKEIEKENLIEYLDNHQDEKENKEVLDFMKECEEEEEDLKKNKKNE